MNFPSTSPEEWERFGQFSILPKGADIASIDRNLYGEVVGYGLHPSCEYCGSIVTATRCDSCGAPLRGKKPEPTGAFRECLHPEIYCIHS